MKKRTRLLLMVAGGALAVLVVLLIALPYLVDVNRYRGLITAKAEEALGREVRLGEMQLSLWPTLGLRVDDLAIGALPEEGEGDLLIAQHLRVGARLLPLMRKQLEVTSITVEAPQLTLVRDAQGRWNVQRLIATQAATQDGGRQSTSASRPEFQIGSLRITSGRVRLRDEATPGNVLSLTLADVDLALRDVSPNRPIQFEASAVWEEMPDSALAASGHLGPLFPAEGEALRAEVTAEASRLDAAGLVELIEAFYPLPDGFVGGDALSATAHVELERDAVTRIAISADRLAVRQPSSTTSRRCVFPSDARIVASSSGRRLRRSTISASTPPPASSSAASTLRHRPAP